MTNTTFSVELKGILLPDNVKEILQAELRSVVLEQIARIDLNKEMSVQSLPESSERGFSVTDQILGFVVKNLGKSAERSTGQPAPILLDPTSLLDPHYLPLKDRLQDAFGSPTTEGMPTDGLSTDILENLYYRPDIRAAVVSNSRALAELLSQDEQAAREFNQLIGGADNATTETERNPLVAAAVVGATAVIVGFVIGYELNK